MDKLLILPHEGHIGTERHFLSYRNRRVSPHSDCDVTSLIVDRHELNITSMTLAKLLADIETNSLAIWIELLMSGAL